MPSRCVLYLWSVTEFQWKYFLFLENSNPKNNPHRAGHPLYFRVITGDYLMFLMIWWFCQGVGARGKEFLLHFRNQFWPGQRRKAGSLQIHTKALPRSSSSCKFPGKNSLETNPELSQEPNSSPNPAQGWICDPGSQTRLWMCIWGWEETSSSLFPAKPGWTGSLGWAGPSFNPGKAMNRNGPKIGIYFCYCKRFILQGEWTAPCDLLCPLQPNGPSPKRFPFCLLSSSKININGKAQREHSGDSSAAIAG